MTPMQYKDRYEEIIVPLNNCKEKRVKVNMYRLRSAPPDKPGGYNATAKQAFMAKLNKNGIDTKLRVDTNAGTVWLDPEMDKVEAAFKKKTKIGVSITLPTAGAGVRMDSSAGGLLPLR